MEISCFFQVKTAMSNTYVAVNDTQISDDPFDGQQPSGTFDLEIFLKYVLATTKFLADLIIIYSLSKFQILKTWENSLIMHWATVDCIHLLLYLIYINILPHFEIKLLLPCFVDSVISTTFLSTVIFAEAILVGFIIMNSKCPILKNRENIFKKLYVLSIYFLCILECIVEFFTCHYHRWFDNLMFATNAILFFSVVLNFSLKKLIKYDGHVSQTYYAVYVSNTVVFSLVPVFGYHYLRISFRSSESFIKFLEATVFITYLILLSNSLVIFIILHRYCRDFRIVVLSIFKKLLMGSGISWSELQQEI